jgi:RNA polymerase sigma-70 factor (ECF subfamily)
MDEQTAIQRLKNKDIGGLEYLVLAHQVKAVRTAYLITRDRALAEDVVQDCFINAYHSISGFDSTRAFEPWFMRSVVHAAVKSAQRFNRDVELDAVMDSAWFEERFTRANQVEGQVEAVLFQKEVNAALAQLSPRQRAVIVQKYYLEMSEKEMAQDSDVANGTIKWLLNAARERLRKLLERSK